MTLPNATLFPQAFLRLYVFEPRYRQMLADALHGNRMFSVALQKPGRTREVPSTIAGLGLIRVAVAHRDGTSHVLLQGIARVRLDDAVRYRPYRVQRIGGLRTPPCDNVKVDALLAKTRELLEERINLGLPFPLLANNPQLSEHQAEPPSASPKEVLGMLGAIANPEQATDLICCAVLPGAAERQSILETPDVESRLRRLIHFLLVEIRSQGKSNTP